MPPVIDYAPDPVRVKFEGAMLEAAAGSIDCRLGTSPARFSRLNDRFGPWGLALLEAIVRLADHTVSGRLTGDRAEGALMAEVFCGGLPASWAQVRGWAAGRSHRCWILGSDSAGPKIVRRRPFCAPLRSTPVEALTDSWPSREALADMPIAESWRDTPATAAERTGRCLHSQSACHPRPSALLDAVVDDDRSRRK